MTITSKVLIMFLSSITLLGAVYVTATSINSSAVVAENGSLPTVEIALQEPIQQTIPAVQELQSMPEDVSSNCSNVSSNYKHTTVLRGDSMNPTIQDGDTVYCVDYPFECLKRDDIVWFKPSFEAGHFENGYEYLIHRVSRWEDENIVAMGDNSYYEQTVSENYYADGAHGVYECLNVKVVRNGKEV